jgi:uncharacterized membrane protein YccC
MLSKLVRDVSDAENFSQALLEPGLQLPRRLQREAAAPGRRTFPKDRGVAVLSAAAALVATLIACTLWIEGSWPDGAIAAQFAAIGCSLFATLDNPSKTIGAAIAGLMFILPLGALYEFAIIPRIDGFASLAVVLAPMLVLFSLMQTYEKLEGAALVLAIGFSGALALQSTYRADFAVFVNSNAAEIVGFLIAIAVNLVFRTIDPLWNARRIAAAGRRAVYRLVSARGPARIRQWTMQMFDRVGLIAERLDTASAPETGAELDSLRDLRVGLCVSALKRVARRQGGRVELEGVMTLIGDMYRLRPGAGLARSPDLGPRIDAALSVVTARRQNSRSVTAVAALTALKLDLAEVVEPGGAGPSLSAT